MPHRQRAQTNVRHNKKQEIQFLRDFDLLTNIEPEEADMYEKADFEKANRILRDSLVMDEYGQKFKLGCEIEEFKKYGPGIYLLFKFLKYSTIAFGVLSLFALANVIIAAVSRPSHPGMIYEGLKTTLVHTTLEHVDSKHWRAFVGISFFMAVLMAAALIFWRQKQHKYIIDCLTVTSLSSYFTVFLKQIPEFYNEGDMQLYLMKKYGEVSEMYTVRDFGDDMLYYKQMNQIVQQYKEEKALVELDPTRSSQKLCSLFFEFRSGHHKMKEKMKSTEHYRACFAFVRFKKIEDRQRLLDDNGGVMHFLSQFCGCFKGRSQDKKESGNPAVNNEQIVSQNPPPAMANYQQTELKFTACEMEPGGIIWENIHLSRSARLTKILIMLGLMLVVLFFSVILIYLMSIVPMSVSNSKFKYYTKQKLEGLNDSFAVWSYCVNLPSKQFYQEKKLCSGYGSEYLRLTFLTLMIPLSISVLRFILTELMKGLVNFRRYAYQIKRIESQATILFIFYFIITGVMQLVMYLATEHNSLVEYFTPTLQSLVHPGFQLSKITLVSDFIPDWYTVSTLNILLIGAISFNMSALGVIFYCLVRRALMKRAALKQKIMAHMSKRLQGYDLQIEYIYASVFTIIFFTVLFGSCMPLLYPLAFISLMIQYWCYKFVFINFCKRPLTYNHSFNRKACNMLYIALIIHCIFAPIFFKAPGIADHQGDKSFIKRIFSMWYYLVLLALVGFYALTRNNFLHILIKLVKKSRQESQIKETEQGELNNSPPRADHCKDLNAVVGSQQNQQPHRRHNFSLPTIVRHIQNKSNQQSYSMHENKLYRQILKILYTINNRERTRKTFVLNKDLFQMYEKNKDERESSKNIVSRDKDKKKSYSRTLLEVIGVVRKDYSECQKKGMKRNPHESNKRKLYEILLKTRNLKNQRYTINPQNTLQIYKMLQENGYNVSEIEKNSLEEGATKEMFMNDGDNVDCIIEEQSEQSEREEREERKDQPIQNVSSQKTSQIDSIKPGNSKIHIISKLELQDSEKRLIVR